MTLRPPSTTWYTKMWTMRKPFRQNEMKYLFTFIETVFLILLVFSYIHDKLLLFTTTKALIGLHRNVHLKTVDFILVTLPILLPRKIDHKSTFLANSSIVIYFTNLPNVLYCRPAIVPHALFICSAPNKYLDSNK